MMTFVSHIPGFGVQHPRQIQIQYPTLVQQPVMFAPQPQFLLMPQLQIHQPPVSIMVPTMVVHPPLFTPPLFIAAPAQPSSDLVDDVDLRRGLTLRIVFYGHPSDDYTRPLCLSSATYKDLLPSRDSLLARIATCAGHHGLVIGHAGGCIDPRRVRLCVLPKSSSPRGLLPSGMGFDPDVGLVVPEDVVKVVRLGGIEEKDWEEALGEVKREGYEAVVAVDMGHGGLNTTTTTTAIVPTLVAATNGDQTAAAAA